MSKPVLLYIDGEVNELEVRKMVLESAGYSVLTAGSSRAGLEIFISQHVDLVLLDYEMPEMNGYDVAVEMRRIGHGIPILMLSDCLPVSPEVLQVVDACAIKGVPPVQLFEKIRVLLKDHSPGKTLTWNDSEMNALVAAILEGDCTESVFQAEQLRSGGASAQQIVMCGIEPAMLALDGKCTLEEFNLLEIMLAGRAVTEVMKLLYPIGCTTAATKATVVIASLEGDVHDLGKNILKMVLTGSRYRVVDCGKDCPLPKLIEVAEKERPLAIGISGLITHIIPLVRQVRGQLRLRGLEQIKVMAGGAALKQSSSDKLNVDFVAESAFDSLHYLEALVGDSPVDVSEMAVE